MEYKPGDVVWLKSGGPSMTIGFIDGHQVYCNWFLNGELKGVKLYPVQLTAVNPDDETVDIG